jgi:hypothetical protein
MGKHPTGDRGLQHFWRAPLLPHKLLSSYTEPQAEISPRQIKKFLRQPFAHLRPRSGSRRTLDTAAAAMQRSEGHHDVGGAIAAGAALDTFGALETRVSGPCEGTAWVWGHEGAGGGSCGSSSRQQAR